MHLSICAFEHLCICAFEHLCIEQLCVRALCIWAFVQDTLVSMQYLLWRFCFADAAGACETGDDLLPPPALSLTSLDEVELVEDLHLKQQIQPNRERLLGIDFWRWHLAIAFGNSIWQ